MPALDTVYCCVEGLHPVPRRAQWDGPRIVPTIGKCFNGILHTIPPSVKTKLTGGKGGGATPRYSAGNRWDVEPVYQLRLGRQWINVCE